MGARIDFQAFRALMAARHSEYHLAPEWVASQESVEGMLGDLLQQIPTHFNCQPVRVVLLTGAAHARHWELGNIALALVRRGVPAQAELAVDLEAGYESASQELLVDPIGKAEASPSQRPGLGLKRLRPEHG